MVSRSSRDKLRDTLENENGKSKQQFEGPCASAVARVIVTIRLPSFEGQIKIR